MSKQSTLRYGIAFLSSVTLFLFLFFILNVEPFNSRYFLTSDLFQQYYIFHTWFGDVLRSGDWNALLYEWTAGLGNNMLGTYMYYLSSPFSLLAVFFNKDTMPLGITLILTLKIGSITTAFYWFLTRLAQKHQWHAYFFALCYAFSGFTITYLMNLMWLDQLIVLPFLCYAALLFVHENRKRPLFIALVASFLVNFYTAYMTGIFIAFFILVEFFKTHPLSAWKSCLKLWIQLLAFALLTFTFLGALLLPTLLQLFSGSESPLSLNVEWLYSPLSLLETLTPGFYDGVQTQHLPPLYFGILPLIFTVAFFFQPDISFKERLLSLILFGFLFISFSFNPLYNFWHGFKSPAWFSGRYSFIFIFYSLYLAFRTFELQLKAKNTRPIRYSIGIIALSFLTLTLLQEINWFTPQHQDSSISSLLLSWIFLLTYSLLLWILLKPTCQLSWRCLFYAAFAEITISAGLILLLFAKDLTLINTSIFENILEEQTQVLADIQALTDELANDSNDFSRYNLHSPLLNGSLLFDYPGVHSFNTLNNTSNIAVLNHLTDHTHFSSSAFFFSQFHPILNSLLGVSILHTPQELTEFYTPTVLNNLYSNPYALSLGFAANSQLLGLDLTQLDGLESQSLLLNALLGQLDHPTEFLTPAKVNIIGAENLEWNEDRFCYTLLNSDEPGIIDYQIYPQADTPTYLSITLPLQNSSDLTLTLNGHVYDELSTSNFIVLPSDVSEITFECTKESDCGIPTLNAFQIHEKAIQTALQTLQQSELKLTEQSSTSLTGTLSSEEDGILFTSIPFDKGWKATLNGESVPTLGVLHQSFLALELPKGEHTITLSYTPPGLKEGLLLSMMTCNGLAFYVLFKFFKSQRR